MKLLYFLFNSSIGRKFVMALTGLFLISFLLVHCGVNALIFWNDGGAIFNRASDFMGTNWVIRTLEVVLFAGLLLHIMQGLWLWYSNAQKRKIKYGKSSGSKNSTWYSRSMGLLGTLLLLFLVLHLAHFWVQSRFTGKFEGGTITMYDEMKEVFHSLWVVLIYVAGCISLGYHLLQGFKSSFQSLGINHKAYNSLISGAGIAFSIFIPLLFALMPVAMYLNWIE